MPISFRKRDHTFALLKYKHIPNIMKYTPKVVRNRLLVKDFKGNELLFDFDKINKLKTVASAIQNSTRVSIINVLSLMGEVRVTEIYKKLKIEQAKCSQHLLILKESDVVQARRAGKCIYYSINPKIKWITQLDPDSLIAASDFSNSLE